MRKSCRGASQCWSRHVSTQKARSRANTGRYRHSTCLSAAGSTAWVTARPNATSRCKFVRTRARLRHLDGAAKRHELLQVLRASRRHGLRRFARCVGCRRSRRNRNRLGRRRLPLAVLVIAQRSSQHAEARQEIHVIPQLGILGERQQPLHRAFEHDDQGRHQSRQEQRVVAME